VIDRSNPRDTPKNALAVRGRNSVRNSRRGNHLGQRSCATAQTGRTYDRKRSDQITAQPTCKSGAVHICIFIKIHCWRRIFQPPLIIRIVSDASAFLLTRPQGQPTAKPQKMPIAPTGGVGSPWACTGHIGKPTPQQSKKIVMLPFGRRHIPAVQRDQVWRGSLASSQ